MTAMKMEAVALGAGQVGARGFTAWARADRLVAEAGRGPERRRAGRQAAGRRHRRALQGRLPRCWATRRGLARCRWRRPARSTWAGLCGTRTALWGSRRVAGRAQAQDSWPAWGGA